jgi:hypothetical protein
MNLAGRIPQNRLRTMERFRRRIAGITSSDEFIIQNKYLGLDNTSTNSRVFSFTEFIWEY